MFLRGLGRTFCLDNNDLNEPSHVCAAFLL